MEPVPFYSDTQSECSKAGHKLIGQDSNPLFVCFACKVGHLKDRPKIVYCEICNSCYHDEHCRYFKPEIRHPFHLSHPLTFVKGHYSRLNDTVSEGSYRKCNCCRGPLLSVGNYYYHCSICNYRVKEYCCRMGPLMLSIAHPKSHEHTLTIFPGRFTFPCNACGESLDDIDNYVYTCLPCSYMVHKTCIYLPRVIKITRHQHRLSHSSFLPLGDFSCGVCHQTVDIDYGQYSCNNGCPYVVHSRCATRDDVWDGIDLEGVPEGPEEDIEPFVRIDEETIQHFSHEHYLRLHQNYIPSGNRYMFCQVCALPIITSASFYSCMECDFVLDEACACLPRKTHHLLHKHPLTLLPICPPWSYETLGGNFDHKGAFRCHGCRRHGCGFVYICRDCDFKLDTRCASLPDPLIHDCHLHDHPLFFHVPQIISVALLRRPHDKPCKACKRGCGRELVLECIKCKFYLCITCATIPRVANYRYDKHPLTLCYGEEDAANLQYWCEICESTLDASKWFYTCDHCRVTLHLTCLLGQDPYMKPNHIFTSYGKEIEAALNGNPRPFCDYCADRCSQHLVFKSQDITFCSLRCSID